MIFWLCVLTIVLTGLLLSVVILLHFHIKSATFSQETLQLMHAELLDMMAIMHAILTRHHLEYFIESGTLLGSVREGNVIPHDDDIDVGVMENDKDRFYRLRPVFEQNGLFFDQTRDVLKIKRRTRCHNLFIDVFFYTQKDGRYVYSEKKHRKWWPNMWFSREELFPLRAYALGDIVVTGPQNPIPYLERAYGDWRTPQKTHNHFEQMRFEKGCQQ